MPRIKLNTNQFIENAKKVHGDKFLYDKVVYVDYRTPVTITCRIHGDFNPWPSTLLKGSGCKRCSARQGQDASNKKAAESFIPRATVKHEYKYDYSKFLYVNSITKSTIICPIHEGFEQTPGNHLNGRGCPKCAKNIVSQKLIIRGLSGQNSSQNTKDLTDLFIKKSQNFHGDCYLYTNTVYVKSTEKVEIICRKHGPFMQLAQAHSRGAGCKKCGDELRGANRRKKFGDQFVELSMKTHSNKYDYSKVSFVAASKKVTVICPKHGEFLARPDHHIRGVGCPICGTESMANKQRMPLQDFIQKAKVRHDDFYDYSQVNYENTHSYITIICGIHGPFDQTPAGHLGGRGCTACGILKYSDAQRFDKKKFITDSKKIHGETYDYSKIDYKGSNIPVTIICPKHGAFEQSYTHHVQRQQKCPSCMNRDMDTKKFITRAKETHGEKYNYSNVDYKLAKGKVVIICPQHGEFKQVAWNHLEGIGCPGCVDHLNSTGSQKIEQWLSVNSIEFEREKTFKSLYNQHKRKYKLRFDFYIPSHELLIEFDGRQHYLSVPLWGAEDGFKRLQENDQKKNEWAEKNSYRLLRIAYFEEDRIDEILTSFID